MELLERVAAGGLLEPGRPVVVLLSGGRDSVCLLDLAVELSGAPAALHVNYGLRDEAAGDEAHCRALCERLGIELAVERAARPDDAPGNLQAWARDVRYATAARLAAAGGPPGRNPAPPTGAGPAAHVRHRLAAAAAPRARIAAAHTATDQAETILYRLAASPGRRALLGMPARSGRLVRPLLGVTREETAEWCRARGLAWREDATNASRAYARGRVRVDLVPALRAVHPAAERNVVRTAELLRDEADVLDVVVDTALAGRDRIAIDDLAALPRALARLVVRRLAEGATGELCARAPGRLDEILALGDGALDLGG